MHWSSNIDSLTWFWRNRNKESLISRRSKVQRDQQKMWLNLNQWSFWWDQRVLMIIQLIIFDLLRPPCLLWRKKTQSLVFLVRIILSKHSNLSRNKRWIVSNNSSWSNQSQRKYLESWNLQIRIKLLTMSLMFHRMQLILPSQSPPLRSICLNNLQSWICRNEQLTPKSKN